MNSIKAEKEELKYKLLMALIYIVYYGKEVTHFTYSLSDLKDINSFTQIICTLMLRIVITGLIYSSIKSYAKLKIIKNKPDDKSREILTRIEAAEDKIFPLEALALVLFCTIITYLVLSVNAHTVSSGIGIAILTMIETFLIRKIYILLKETK